MVFIYLYIWVGCCYSLWGWIRHYWHVTHLFCKRGKVNHSARYFSSLQEFGLLIHATQLTLSQLNSTNPVQLYSKVSFLISICCSRKMCSSVDLICHSAVSYAHMFHMVYLNLINGTGACIEATKSDSYGTAVGRQCWSSVYRELFTQVS